LGWDGNLDVIIACGTTSRKVCGKPYFQVCTWVFNHLYVDL